MKILILDLYVVFMFVIVAHITESYKVYFIDKQGQISELKNNTHTSKHSPKTIKDKIVLHLSNTLRKSKKHTSRSHKSKKKNKNSPVIYSNGRYVLDLDKIDIKDVKHVTNQPEKDKDYFDPAESFNDYYEFININDRLRTPTDKEGTSKKKSKKRYSRRKFSQILFANKEGFGGLNRVPKPKKSRFENKNNRFKIIDNTYRKEKFVPAWTAKMWEKTLDNLKKIKRYKVYTDSEVEFSADSDSGITEEQQTESSEDKSPESASNYYLQGNQFVDLMTTRNKDNKVKKNKRDSETDETDENDSNNSTDSDTDSGTDSGNTDSSNLDSDSNLRRRLPSFMPKRYHWDLGDIKKLGYFWFNGNKGRYPTPINLT